MNINYEKGDLRRLLSVLGAIAALKSSASLVNIASSTRLSKKTVLHLIQAAGEQAGVSLKKDGYIYSIIDIGPVLKLSGIDAAFRRKPISKRLDISNANSSNSKLEKIK